MIETSQAGYLIDVRVQIAASAGGYVASNAAMARQFVLSFRYEALADGANAWAVRAYPTICRTSRAHWPTR